MNDVNDDMVVISMTKEQARMVLAVLADAEEHNRKPHLAADMSLIQWIKFMLRLKNLFSSKVLYLPSREERGLPPREGTVQGS